jgi:hypothetical protein
MLQKILLALLIVVGFLAPTAALACGGYYSCEEYDGYTACYWYGG